MTISPSNTRSPKITVILRGNFFSKHTNLDDVGLVPIGMPLGSLPAGAGAREGHRTPPKPLQGTHRTDLEDVISSGIVIINDERGIERFWIKYIRSDILILQRRISSK